MQLAMFYDTETDGLPLWREPSDHPDQPHIVQLAACLVDVDTRKVISSLDLVIAPVREIPEDVAAIHGITTEYAEAVGVTERLALDLFIDLWHTRPRVAHNESFDARIIRIALKRYMGDEIIADVWKAGAAECTARLSSPIIKLPATAAMHATGRHHPKTPKLTEMYSYFFGEEMRGAHSAMADVRACLECYWKIKDLQHAEAG